MFDSLSDKLQSTLADVRRHGTLTEQDIDAAMREIRLALLEADVNFKVVRQFTAQVKKRCLDAEIVGKLNPGQQVVKIVAEELASLMGAPSAPGSSASSSSVSGSSVPGSSTSGSSAPGSSAPGSSASSLSVPGSSVPGAPGTGSDEEAHTLRFAAHPPTVILMAGLQGSGKTTATAKLARYLREERGAAVAVAACDTYRPAAVDQLVKVGARAGAEVYEQGTERDPVDIAVWALGRAREEGKDVLIVDTSGRLHIDEQLMDELVRMRAAVEPTDVLLVLDAMTGQDAAAVAERFGQEVQFDGVIMSKLDGDARGGAALSVKAITGKPIMFASTGERLEQFERFHPDRMAQRILGMGDVMSLIEQAERQFDEDETRELQRKLKHDEFGLDDFLSQLKTIRRMGPLTNLLGMIPGLAGHQLQNMKFDERELDRIQAIILSMTPSERSHPELIKGSRRLRIARGSGTNVQQVNQLVKQFGHTRQVMKQVGRGRMPDIGALMRQAR